MAAKRKHFVDFFSPGTFAAEGSRRSIPSWDTAKAVKIAKKIKERHGAVPYCFCFVTYICADPVSDGEGGKMEVKPKEVERSGMYYLTGEILKYDDIPENEDNHILRSNMRCNDNPVSVVNTNSYKWTANFNKDDVIVDDKGKVVRCGSDDDIRKYREQKIKEFKASYAE